LRTQACGSNSRVRKTGQDQGYASA
jgi:hypothetical protein